MSSLFESPVAARGQFLAAHRLLYGEPDPDALAEIETAVSGLWTLREYELAIRQRPEFSQTAEYHEMTRLLLVHSLGLDLDERSH